MKIRLVGAELFQADR